MVEQFARDAPERHAHAAGRRPSADRQPAAHVGRDGGVPGAGVRPCVALPAGTQIAARTDGSVLGRAAVPAWHAVRLVDPGPGHCSAKSASVSRARVAATPSQPFPLETYVARVLAGEAARDSQPAALEALAIAVRTYTLANRGRHRADGFDLCDDNALSGHADANAGDTSARRPPPPAACCCAAARRPPSTIRPRAADRPRSRRRSGPAPTTRPTCRRGPTMGAGERRCGRPSSSARICCAPCAPRASAALGSATCGSLSRNGSGRVARLRLAGSAAGGDFRSGSARRWWDGRSAGNSSRARRSSSSASAIATGSNGHGSGHGVGMCVIGSMHLAVAGRTATEILHRYYPGLAIGRAGDIDPAAGTLPRPAAARLPPHARSPVPPSAAGRSISARESRPAADRLRARSLLSLPDGDEGERESIALLPTRRATDLARALGVPLPRA